MKASARLQWPPIPDRSGNSSQHRVDTVPFIIHTCSSYAVAQPHEHSQHHFLHRPIITVVAEQCSCVDSENVMASAEQMQEAHQQIQMLTARIMRLDTVASIGHRDTCTQSHGHSESAKNSQWLWSSACASTVRTSWRLLSKCRRDFSSSNTNFKFRELVSRRWKHSCNSDQPELSKLSKRGAR